MDTDEISAYLDQRNIGPSVKRLVRMVDLAALSHADPLLRGDGRAAAGDQQHHPRDRARAVRFRVDAAHARTCARRERTSRVDRTAVGLDREPRLPRHSLLGRALDRLQEAEGGAGAGVRDPRLSAAPRVLHAARLQRPLDRQRHRGLPSSRRTQDAEGQEAADAAAGPGPAAGDRAAQPRLPELLPLLALQRGADAGLLQELPHRRQHAGLRADRCVLCGAAT